MFVTAADNSKQLHIFYEYIVPALSFLENQFYFVYHFDRYKFFLLDAQNHFSQLIHMY